MAIVDKLLLRISTQYTVILILLKIPLCCKYPNLFTVSLVDYIVFFLK